MSTVNRVAKRFIEKQAVFTGDTAEATYKTRMTELRGLIKTLEANLDKHEKDFKKKPKDWGYAEDLGHWIKEIKSIIDP